jgi:hypothetical protein
VPLCLLYEVVVGRLTHGAQNRHQGMGYRAFADADTRKSATTGATTPAGAP